MLVWFCLDQQAKKSRIVASNEVLDKSRGAACFGSSCLTELLTSYAANAENEAALRVGIVGKHSFPQSKTTFFFLFDKMTFFDIVLCQL